MEEPFLGGALQIDVERDEPELRIVQFPQAGCELVEEGGFADAPLTVDHDAVVVQGVDDLLQQLLTAEEHVLPADGLAADKGVEASGDGLPGSAPGLDDLCGHVGEAQEGNETGDSQSNEVVPANWSEEGQSHGGGRRRHVHIEPRHLGVVEGLIPGLKFDQIGAFLKVGQDKGPLGGHLPIAQLIRPRDPIEDAQIAALGVEVSGNVVNDQLLIGLDLRILQELGQRQAVDPSYTHPRRRRLRSVEGESVSPPEPVVAGLVLDDGQHAGSRQGPGYTQGFGGAPIVVRDPALAADPQ